MSKVELKQYKNGVRLLFDTQEDYESCNKEISKNISITIRFWGKNKFVTDRDEYPWYLYCEYNNSNDLDYLQKLISNFKNNSTINNEVVRTIIQKMEGVESIDSLENNNNISNEKILNALEEVDSSIDKLDETVLIQFAAISRQISEGMNKIDLSKLTTKLEYSLKDYINNAISPFLGKISGADDKVNEILKSMDNVTQVAILKREKSEILVEKDNYIEKIKNLEIEQKDKDDYYAIEKEEFIAKIAKYTSIISQLELKENDKHKNTQNSDSKYELKLLEILDGDQHSLTPLICLRFIENLQAGNIIVLPSARESAEKSDVFENGLLLLILLNKLVVKYLPAFIEGGDTKAKDIFSKDMFAAKESDTTMAKYPDSRTFEYHGKNIKMLRHLKIGNATNKKFTLRVHFHVDLERKQIVIGYCGVHLPI